MLRGLPVLALCAGIAAFSHVSAMQTKDSSARAVPPFRGEGARLVDAQGQEVRITGVNWFGFETDTFAPHGLWARNYGDMLDQIVAAGFNTLRLPYSNQLFEPASVPRGIDFQKNPDLQGLRGLSIMDRIIEAAGQRGLHVILDRHRPTAAAQSELWYSSQVPEARWIQDWVMLAQHYAGNPTVVGADLHNEPHGPATWGDGNPTTDWRMAAERAGNAILATAPDWLIVVEGIEHHGNDWYWWGGNLAGVRTAPVRLSAPGKLVYSTHDYGPGVYYQRWFGAPEFPANLPRVWRDHWAYLHDDDVAPVLVGEFGGRSVGADAEGIWQRSLLRFLRDNGFSYTYWAWNPDSGDTGGVLGDDWSTLDQRKLAMLSSYQWPFTATTAITSEVLAPPPIAFGVQPPITSGMPPVQPTLLMPPTVVAQPVVTAPVTGFAIGGPFDPDFHHVMQGIGGPNDPDALHRQAREQDERRYQMETGKRWPFAAYNTGTSEL